MTSLMIRPVARAALVLAAGTVLALSANAAGRARGPVAVPVTQITTPPIVVSIPAIQAAAPSTAPVIVNPVVSCNAGGTGTVSRC